MKYSNTQIRMPENQLVTGTIITHQSKMYQLGSPIPCTLENCNKSIAMVGDGYTAQFELMQDGLVVGEGWFYCYHSREKKFWAVLDEIQLLQNERKAV